MEKRIITISREYGSGGRQVGLMVAKRLGMEFYDKELIDAAAKEIGFPAETVAAKVAHGFRTLGAQRFQLKVSTGRLSHEAIMDTIGLYGTEVVPLVKDMLSDS